MPKRRGRPLPSERARGGDGTRKRRPSKRVPKGRRGRIHGRLELRPPEFGGKEGLNAIRSAWRDGRPQKSCGVHDKKKRGRFPAMRTVNGGPGKIARAPSLDGGDGAKAQQEAWSHGVTGRGTEKKPGSECKTLPRRVKDRVAPGEGGAVVKDTRWRRPAEP